MRKVTDLSGKAQALIVVVLVLMMTTIGGLIYGIYSVYSVFRDIGNHVNQPLPKEIEKARIVKGDGFLEKTEVFKLDADSTWETVRKASTEQDTKKREKIISSETAKKFYGFDDIKICGDEIVAVGKFGGYAFDKNFKITREIIFEPAERKVNILFFEQTTYEDTLDDLEIIDFENDGKCEFIAHNSIHGLTVFNGDGNVYWRYGKRDFDPWATRSDEEKEKEVYVIEKAVGDLNEDGIAEIIVSLHADGIRAFNFNKRELWYQPDNFPTADFELIDIDGDGNTELFEFQGASSQIRDKQTGYVKSKLEIDGWEKEIIENNFDKSKEVRFFHFSENQLLVTNKENKTILEADAPLSTIKTKPKKHATDTECEEPEGNMVRCPGESISGDETLNMYSGKTAWVKLEIDKPKYLAIVGTIADSRSNLYLYTTEGELVYHELLPERADAITVLPRDNELEEILIGGKDTIWRFGKK